MVVCAIVSVLASIVGVLIVFSFFFLCGIVRRCRAVFPSKHEFILDVLLRNGIETPLVLQMMSPESIASLVDAQDKRLGPGFVYVLQLAVEALRGQST